MQNKSLLTMLGETLDAYREQQKQVTLQRQRPHKAFSILRWLIPNGGTLLIVAVLILTQSVWARPFAATNAPGPSATTVNYQGRLADNAGTPLDGSYGMSFALYDAASAGNLVWGPEVHDAVLVSDGLFSVGLGSRTAGGIPTTTWNGDRYLEITVGGETLSPRELIRSVPIAGMALTVPDGAIGSSQIADGAVSLEKLAPEVNVLHFQSGRVHTGRDDPEWTLDEGTGSRNYTKRINFSEPFPELPNVQVSLYKIDSSHSTNQRIVVWAENVTTEGFDLVVYTWNNTVIYSAGTTWFAHTSQ